ncbi:MAG: T9SS type A sorting domain-containing protein [Ignavibacteria bacterium]|nr:T9SS type A sorting domain-containing protein [Ignavibacteria bacterium]
MWKITLFILLFTGYAFSQNDFIGKSDITITENGSLKKQTVLNPLPNKEGNRTIIDQNASQPVNMFNNTSIRWTYTEPAAIGDFCKVSGNGKYSVVSWNLNNHRISLYGNTDANPVWDFATDPNGYLNYISISDTGGTVSAGSYRNTYFFNNTSNVPFFNYDLTHLIDTGTAGSLDVTGDGKFVVCSAGRQDSSTIFGFSTSSGDPVWSKRIIPTVPDGSLIQGVKLSGNDSIVIVNTYYDFYVFKTFTGELLYQGLISGGTQTVQGINGDGSIIAIINYVGILRVFQWNGTTYDLLFQNQEPPGMFYNWYACVDVSYDGNYIAAGTLNFISTTEVDGKIKVFKKNGGGTPFWTYSNCGDEVSAVSFSKSGNILSAASWGEFNNLTEDLYIFKTSLGNVPVYKVNTPGSFFWCSTSDDGRTVVASGKAVHARQFGNGGLMYNLDVDTNDVPSSINPVNSNVVSDYKLSQNYPNPFNPSTNLEFGISDLGFVSLKVYDLNGRELQTLVNENLSPGNYKIKFDGSNLSSGIYFYKIIAGSYTETKQMILLK